LHDDTGRRRILVNEVNRQPLIFNAIVEGLRCVDSSPGRRDAARDEYGQDAVRKFGDKKGEAVACTRPRQMISPLCSSRTAATMNDRDFAFEPFDGMTQSLMPRLFTRAECSEHFRDCDTTAISSLGMRLPSRFPAAPRIRAAPA